MAKIGFIGLGIMGESMCANIVKKHNDTVYCSDLNKDKVKQLEAQGAVGCADNIEVAKNADIIITMVPKSEHVKGVYTELLPYITPDMICIDMSTIDPAVSVEVANTVKATGAQFADCPVVKSKAAAIAGDLGVLAGCDRELFDVIKPILSYMGSHVIYMGTNGAGITMKICHNALVGEIQNGVNETLLLAQQFGISIDDYYAAVAAGGAQNIYLDNQHDKIKFSDWTTAFSFENMNKDIHIAKGLAEQTGVDLPGINNVVSVYEKGMAQDLCKEDFRSTYKVVKQSFGD